MTTLVGQKVKNFLGTKPTSEKNYYFRRENKVVVIADVGYGVKSHYRNLHPQIKQASQRSKINKFYVVKAHNKMARSRHISLTLSINFANTLYTNNKFYQQLNNSFCLVAASFLHKLVTPAHKCRMKRCHRYKIDVLFFQRNPNKKRFIKALFSMASL